MKIIEKQNAELWSQEPGMEGMYKHIERAARVCYQSQDSIKADSAGRMVNALIRNGHTAMLEHGTVYLTFRRDEMLPPNQLVLDPHTMCTEDDDNLYITTNYRVLVEKGLTELLKYDVTEPSPMHKRRSTLYLTTNLQVATEYIRHRLMSFAMESTRYCSYDKEKFGNELTFILPLWLREADNTIDNKLLAIEWTNAMQDAENHYMRLKDKGWTAQQCAQVLPKATKTSLVMTGFDDDWDKFFDLRYFEKTGAAHPQAKELATMIYELLKGGK